MYYNTLPIFAININPFVIGLLITLVVVSVALFLLYRFGTKLQKRQEDSQSQMQANSQSVSMLVIDKKRMKLTEAGLPKLVLESTPKYLRGRKVPIVKAKIGPKILSLICDEKIFDVIPVKKEVKAVISGIYIMEVRGLRTSLETKPEKKGFFAKLRSKAQKKVNESK
ncbi:hypothetical protein [Anaeromicropila populeti]|uniref:Uncharacterized protein n=1 Tax=Anaeromicropila populeti TaxID=37658 RepID=A0A1I6I686_9FIRM|nr:hypothetical protein [Anaeromicropila populeti]SFR62232.1 hypothetical protein SAMN05661086_00464 [Anaeromicropila populeti]